jgi:hypothetical protein
MELAKVLDRVRKLIAKAEGTDNAHEAQAFREAADDLMQKYAIEEWQTAQQAQLGLKPTRIKIDIGEGSIKSNPLLEQTAVLVGIVADFCKCSSIWVTRGGYGEDYCWVYGYESDLRYFELLYTTIYLHMSEAILFTSPDPAKSEGANIRDMRHAGLNWNDVAAAYGWQLLERDGSNTTYLHRTSGDVKKWGQVVGRIKRLYAQEIKARNEQPFSLGRGGAGNVNFRYNAARGYVSRIYSRLRELAGHRTAGTEIVLRDKTQNIADMIFSDFGEVGSAKLNAKKYNAEAYRRGVRHADTADLQPGRAAEAGERPALG